jgi:hypothetical protein
MLDFCSDGSVKVKLLNQHPFSLMPKCIADKALEQIKEAHIFGYSVLTVEKDLKNHVNGACSCNAHS